MASAGPRSEFTRRSLPQKLSHYQMLTARVAVLFQNKRHVRPRIRNES